MFRATNLSSHNVTIEEENASIYGSDGMWLFEFLVKANLNHFSELDASVTNYVSGYIARSVSRRRNCMSC